MILLKAAKVFFGSSAISDNYHKEAIKK